MLDRAKLKREAKEIIRSARVSAFLFTILYLVITTALRLCSNYVNCTVPAYMELYFPGVPVPEFLSRAAEISPTVVIFVSVMAWMLSAVLMAGHALYHLGIRRGEEMSYGTMFDGFSFVGKVILLQIIISTIVSLLYLLLIVPGVIASYRYRFALYNLCENPEIGVMQAIHLSARQTHGYKMDLFVLDMSFLGWSMLSVLTLGLAGIWVTPYLEQANIGYFQQIKQMKGLGWFPPQEDEFTAQDPYDPGV